MKLNNRSVPFVLLFLLLWLAGCNSEWQRYNNKEYNFSILLPSSWQKEEGVLKTVIMAMAPVKAKPTPSIRANMNVIVTDLPGELKLSTYFEFNKDELTSKLGAAMDNFLEGDIYAGFLPGKWLSFEGMMRGSRMKIISAVWMKGRRVYTITCSSQLEEFSKYEPIFNEALRSLRVK